MEFKARLKVKFELDQRRRQRLQTQSTCLIMAPQAGPSNPPTSKRSKIKAKPTVKSGKVKKITEKQRIADLERAATQFVSIRLLTW